MYDFNKIIGHKEIVDRLKSIIQNEKVSHAYIFHGENGSGKKHLAYAFAKVLQCSEHKDTSCNQCESCKQVETGNHPDIISINKEKLGSITIGEVRSKLNATIDIKPYNSKYKIYIIDEAENLTAQAQNAILKTIEEPPEYAIIIILTSNLDALLQTITSRCLKIEVKPISEKLIREFVIKECLVPEERVNLCVSFAQGNIGRAKKLATSKEFHKIKEETIHLLKYINEMEVYEIIESIKNLTHNKLQINDCLNLMMTWYRDLLIIKTTNNISSLVYKEEYGELKSQVERISYNNIDNIIKAIETAIIRIEANVNYEMAIELMLLTMKEK